MLSAISFAASPLSSKNPFATDAYYVNPSYQKELDSSPLSPREPLHLVMQLGGITLTLSTIALAYRTPGVFPAVGSYLPT